MKVTARKVRVFISAVAVLSLLSMSFPWLRVSVAAAAGLTTLKDVMSTIADGAGADHTISFVAPSAVANSTTIAVTFPTGFDLSTIVEDDVDISGSTAGDLTTAATCAGTEKASVVIVAQTITFTLCTGDAGSFNGTETITIKIGTNATLSGTGSHQIVNQSVAQNTSDPTVDLTTALDSGSLAVAIITDDSLNITSNVDPSITFSISDTTIGFGTLSASAARWASSDAAGSATDVVAHTMALSTNATGGSVVTYNGNTLNGTNGTIDVANLTDSASGTPGTEQFGMSIATNGDATITAGYGYAGTPDWKFVVSTTTTIITDAASATETFSMHYLANISGLTEAGSYSTDITYIATGTF
ncbi:MAG: hypothetical protein V1778_05115 [bacterium]